MQYFFETNQLLDFSLEQAGNRNSGPGADHLGDVFGIDLFFQHDVVTLQAVESRGGFVDLGLELGNEPIANFGRLVQVVLTLHVEPELFELLFARPNLIDRVLLALPMNLHCTELLRQVGNLDLEIGKAFLRCAIGLLFKRNPFHLELAHAPIDDVDLHRNRVDLDAQF